MTNEQYEIQRVVCAAARITDSQVIASPRHHDNFFRAIIKLLPELERKKWLRAEQGFIDQFGNFLNRHEAWVIAIRQNQVIRDLNIGTGKLYSEHLY